MSYLEHLSEIIHLESIEDEFLSYIMSTGDQNLDVQVIDEKGDNYEVTFETTVSTSFLESEINWLENHDLEKPTKEAHPFIQLISKYTRKSYDGMRLDKDIASICSDCCFFYVNGVYTEFDIRAKAFDIPDKNEHPIKYNLQTNKPTRIGRNTRDFIRNSEYECDYAIRRRNRGLIEEFSVAKQD